MLEANIPNAIAELLINKNPSMLTNTALMFGSPKYPTIKKYINENSNVITITDNAAKNFPKTTPTILTGDVNISCSVPVFLSSENILIVSIGAIIISPYNAE